MAQAKELEKEDLIDLVRDYLDEEGYHYEYHADKGFLELGFNLKSKLKEVRMIVDFKKHGFIVLALAPLNADKDNLGEILKYIAMANYGLVNGNFELDVRDGEIRYKVWTGTEGLATLPKPIIEDAINIPCAMMDRYGNGIAALALGFSDADAEIKKVEGEDA